MGETEMARAIRLVHDWGICSQKAGQASLEDAVAKEIWLAVKAEREACLSDVSSVKAGYYPGSCEGSALAAVIDVIKARGGA